MDHESTEPEKAAVEDPVGVTGASETRPKWSKPVLVPLSIALTELNPGVGSDGGIPIADSCHA